MTYITEKIESSYKDIDVISSDENADKLIIRIRMIHSTDNKKMTKEETHSEEILKYLENAILKDLSLKGIPDIRKVYVKEAKRPYFDQSSGAFVTDKMKEWVIETDGTDIFDVFLIDDVDFTRTYSNDINEIYSVLGVEAVRKSLINELISVLKPYDIYVNYRHIAVLCDVMTQRGILTAITRHGINRVELGALRKCSFEETVEILLDAGLFSETDNLTGITENIMVGQLAPFGTGCFDLLLDMQKIQNARLTEETKLMEEEENFLGTPMIGNSPPHTPFIGTPNPTGGMTTYQMFTPGGNKSPSFTPGYEGMIQSPSYHHVIQGYRPDTITTPNPLLSPNSIMSPAYKSTIGPGSDYYKTPYSPQPYSPIYEVKEGDEVVGGSQYYVSNQYSPTSTPGTSKSPYISNNIPQQYGNSNAYSPNSPYYSGVQKPVNKYHGTTTPSYIQPGSNYSPTTTPLNRGVSPDYVNYSVKSSQYSGSISPKIQDSVGSSHSSQNYSPRSPTYNPKSPSYNTVPTSKYIFIIM